ncbi:MAG: hypothetical protein M4579_002577 [Chaenotheca gracillima]|nr:MAG: hypothetical protein M4579_002577 [Chaenotheca gracillima]
MFKKKPNIKPLSPLRSSDRRRLADQIIADFNIQVPSGPPEDGPEEAPEGKAPSNVGLTSLRNSILPDNALSARFSTTVGAEQRKVSGEVYIGTHVGKEQRVLWIQYDGRMHPTVYTLWQNPGIVPLLHTPGFVMQKLKGGADLMTPGLANGPPFPPSATKGSIVAVAQLENPSVPLFVGICEIDVGKLKAVQGEKGRAVHGVHWMNDEIWAWGPPGKSGGDAPEELDGWAKTDGDVAGIEESLGRLTATGSPEKSPDKSRGPKPSQKAPTPTDSVDDAPQNQDDGLFERVEDDERELSTKEIDNAFRKAFTYGVYHHKTSHPDEPNYSLSFPLTTSFIMSNLVLPFLPAFTTAQSASLQMKKTSWKNVRKFIKALEKDLLLKSKDRNGGETVVLDIDFEDRAVAEFVPYKLPKKGAGIGSTGGVGVKGGPTGSTSDPSVGQQLKRIGLYRPKEKLSPMFEAANSSIKALYLSTEIRSIVIGYVESESLVDTTNRRLIKLNPFLANAVIDSNTPLDKQILAKGDVQRDTLVDRVIGSCSPYWAILRGSETKDDVKPSSGKPPQVQILLETRSGNKTVTKLSGVEAYHIQPQSLAEELQKVCASSTSVSQLVGSSPRNPVMEVLVQGPQTKAVTKALEDRGLQKTWIEVVDKTKGKKR